MCFKLHIGAYIAVRLPGSQTAQVWRSGLNRINSEFYSENDIKRTFGLFGFVLPEYREKYPVCAKETPERGEIVIPANTAEVYTRNMSEQFGYLISEMRDVFGDTNVRVKCGVVMYDCIVDE